MKFLIDANMPRSTKPAIGSLGHEVIDIRDVLPPATKDEEIALLALKENRIILTRDQDFANILLYAPEQYAGIIVLKVKALAPSEINNLLKLFLDNVSPDTITHSLIILEPNRFRIRK